jgi:hypothetical protein
MLSDSALDRARSFKLADADDLTEEFFWQARSALDVLNAVNAAPDERARATRLWAALFRVVHSSRDETSGEKAQRIGRIDKLAAGAGLSPILFHLREFAFDIGYAILASPGPVEAAAPCFRDPPREGNPGRPFNERIAMAADVQKKRWLGMTEDDACKEFAKTTHNPHIGKEAVRSIYENVRKEKKAAALMRVIAAGPIMDAAASDPLIRDSAIICPRCHYETMMRDIRRLRASSKVHPKN